VPIKEATYRAGIMRYKLKIIEAWGLCRHNYALQGALQNL